MKRNDLIRALAAELEATQATAFPRNVAERIVLCIDDHLKPAWDPEPVELPRLDVQHYCKGWFPKPLPAGLTSAERTFSATEAREIARRCNAWPELRRYIQERPERFSNSAMHDLLAILDGREP